MQDKILQNQLEMLMIIGQDDFYVRWENYRSLLKLAEQIRTGKTK